MPSHSPRPSTTQVQGDHSHTTPSSTTQPLPCLKPSATQVQGDHSCTSHATNTQPTHSQKPNTTRAQGDHLQTSTATNQQNHPQRLSAAQVQGVQDHNNTDASTHHSHRPGSRTPEVQSDHLRSEQSPPHPHSQPPT